MEVRGNSLHTLHAKEHAGEKDTSSRDQLPHCVHYTMGEYRSPTLEVLENSQIKPS